MLQTAQLLLLWAGLGVAAAGPSTWTGAPNPGTPAACWRLAVAGPGRAHEPGQGHDIPGLRRLLQREPRELAATPGTSGCTQGRGHRAVPAPTTPKRRERRRGPEARSPGRAGG